MAAPGFAELLLILLTESISGVGLILLLWRIAGKAGFHPGLSLLVLIPVVIFVMLYVAVFVEWPSLKRER
ncbi:MAG: hypothetical protein NTU47_11315 [Ignavibacteriales bacterium]|nr:hypothetical protein [Ignavibacteriales bacterium]